MCFETLEPNGNHKLCSYQLALHVSGKGYGHIKSEVGHVFDIRTRFSPGSITTSNFNLETEFEIVIFDIM